jgi:segregation and condensation protein A
MEDLLKAFRSGKRGSEPSHYVVVVNRFFSIEATAARLRARLGDAATAMLGWGTLRHFLPERLEQEPQLTRRSAIASTLAASLQLVKSGELELRQDGSFGSISIRRCQVRTASVGSG